MIGKLLKYTSYLIIVLSLLMILIAMVDLFHGIEWQKTRMYIISMIIIMLVMFYFMYEYRRSKYQFYFFALIAFLLAFIEIPGLLSLMYKMIIGQDVINSPFDSIINTILIVFGILFNMIAGVWMADRITEVERNY